jgi:undecaprenyl-diphosphatase
MIPKLKITFVFILCILSLLCFSLVATLVHGQQIAQFDHQMISLIQGMESPGLTLFMKVFTIIGSTPIVVILALSAMLFLYFVLHHRFELIFFISIVAGTAIINTLLKLYFVRQRPDLHRLIQETGYSFPSGHSMEAFALYASLAFLLWRHLSTRIGRSIIIILCVLMIILIGMSRIYLGVHYPSDVIGGYLASGVYFTLGVWLFQWYKEYRAYNKKVKQKSS